jgi:hypothetical protein
MIQFIVGLFVGCFIGIFVMCLSQAAKDPKDIL